MTRGARGAQGRSPFGEVRGPAPASSGSPDAGGPPARPSRLVIFSFTVVGIMANTLIAPAIPDILADLQVSAGRAGLLVAAATLPGIVVAPAIGLLADRYGRREVVIPCLVVFGLFGGLASFAPSFSVLLLCRLAQGVGSAGLINLAVVILADHWDGPDRARVIGQNSAVLTVSLALLPPLGGALTDLAGWRATFVPYWLGLLAAVGAGVVLPRSPRRDVRVGEQVREALGYLRSARVLVAMATGMTLFVLVFGLVLTALPLHLADEFRLGATSRGLILGLPAVTATLGALTLGRLTARFGARRLVLAGSVVMGMAFAVIGWAPALVGVVAGALLYGLGEGASIPSLQSIVAGAAPTSSRGSVVAVWVGGVRAGQTAGPLLAGAAVAGLGARPTFLVGAGVAAALLATQILSGHPSDIADGEAAFAVRAESPAA